MTSRATAVAVTRARIVDAAKTLHTEQGVAATSWEEIAKRARVSTATAYRHFPSLAELIPACARSVFDVIRPPTVEQASLQFATLDSASDRLEQLVRNTVHCYALGEGWLHAADRERDFVPELSQALQVIEDTLRVLIVAAAGRRLARADHRLLFVLCDFPLWKSLIDAGTPRRATEDTLVRMVRTEAARLGLDHPRPVRSTAP